MQPGYNLPGAAKNAMPFNVSLGRALSSYPLVDFALGLIELAFHTVEFDQASHLIRSPFLGGADTELGRRASLDVEAAPRRRRRPSRCPSSSPAPSPRPLLRKHLEQMFEITQDAEPASPAEWARHFSALLEAAGFPGERALDSDEFQTRAKWHEMLGELSQAGTHR